MKNTIITAVLSVLAVYILSPTFIAQRAEAAPAYTAAPGTPPIGAVCEVSVIASILSARTETQLVKGNLLAMTSEWLALKDGSFENWIPREKVITLRASL